MKRNIVIATVTAAALAAAAPRRPSPSGDDEATATQRADQRERPGGLPTATTRADAAGTTPRDGRRRRGPYGGPWRRRHRRRGDRGRAEAHAGHAPSRPTWTTTAPTRGRCDVVKGDGTGYNVRIAPDTGKVLGAQRDTDDDSDGDDRAELAALKGSEDGRPEAALAAAAKGTVTEVGIDDDNGTWPGRRRP